MKNLNKIFSLVMWVLIAIGVILLVLGFVKGWPSLGQPDNGTVTPLLNWAYILFFLAIACIILFGIGIQLVNDPKSMIKPLIGFIAALAIAAVVYAVSKGNPAIGYNGAPVTAKTLKLTDTVLNLTYVLGTIAVIAVIVGEIISAIRSK